MRYTVRRMAQDIIEELRRRTEGGEAKVRAVARTIVGEKASKERIESKRRHLIKLMRGDKDMPPPQPEPATIRQIATALDLDPALYLPEPKPRRASTAAQVAEVAARLEELATRFDALASSNAGGGQAAPAAPSVLPEGLEGSVGDLLEWQHEVMADLGALDRRLEQLETRRAGEAGPAGEGTGL